MDKEIKFFVKRIFVKDISFESPEAPGIFGNIKSSPKIGFNLDDKIEKIDDTLNNIIDEVDEGEESNSVNSTIEHNQRIQATGTALKSMNTTFNNKSALLQGMTTALNTNYQTDDSEQCSPKNGSPTGRTNFQITETKETEEENQGKTVVKKQDMELCTEIKQSVYRHPQASTLIETCEHKEIAAYKKINGVLCKGKADGFSSGFMFELLGG